MLDKSLSTFRSDRFEGKKRGFAFVDSTALGLQPSTAGGWIVIRWLFETERDKRLTNCWPQVLSSTPVYSLPGTSHIDIGAIAPVPYL